MPCPIPSQSRESEHRYLRLLKRRQRTSLWLERLAVITVLVALVCFINEQVTGGVLSWLLGMGCLLLALVFMVAEAIDSSLEEKQRQHQARLRIKKNEAQDDSQLH